MKRNALLIISAIIAILLLVVAIFTKDWIFYLLIACLVFVVSVLWNKKLKQK